MRGSRSLGLALFAATLGVTPALAQQQSNNAPPANAPAASTPNVVAPTAPKHDQMAATSSNPATNAPANENANQPTGDKSAAATPAPAANAGAENSNPANPPHNATATNPPPSATSPAPAVNPTAANPPPPNTTAANTNQNGPKGSLQMSNGEWRASKLVGATVYNSNGDDVGSIDDLLMGNDGKITQAVISTGGGVLGIGAKLIAVPFDQLKFEPSAGNQNAAAPAAAPGSRTTTGNATAPAAVPEKEHPTRYSIVLPDATKDSLTKQQEFKYASSG
jgi:sporulation protein YlmC with PRC-barrel domain